MNIIRSYYIDRSPAIYVTKNGFNAIQPPIDIGVPQGSILGP